MDSLLFYVGNVRFFLALVLVIVIAYFVFQDAKKRKELLFNIPPWCWALFILSTSGAGIVVYWLANCSTFIKKATIGTKEE